MFAHAVLFEIKGLEIPKYKRDNLMWAGFAKKARGFIAYFTVRRLGHKNQYASVYVWKNKACHDRFMKKLHDWLVTKSKARVKVLGYYNLKAIQQIS